MRWYISCCCSAFFSLSWKLVLKHFFLFCWLVLIMAWFWVKVWKWAFLFIKADPSPAPHSQHPPPKCSWHFIPCSWVLMRQHMCHHVALQKDKHQLPQKKGITVSCSVAEDTRIAWLPSSHSVVLDSLILKVFSSLFSPVFWLAQGRRNGEISWGNVMHFPLGRSRTNLEQSRCSGQHLCPSITEECHWAGASHSICPLQAEQGLHLTTSPELAAGDSSVSEVF